MPPSRCWAFTTGKSPRISTGKRCSCTLIGTALGLLLGMGLHQFVIRTAEVDMVMFGRAVYWPSYVYSAVLTILFGMPW